MCKAKEKKTDSAAFIWRSNENLTEKILFHKGPEN